MRPRACGAIIKGDHILMVHHRDEQKSYWTLPGGGIEPGETPEEAVVREVREEAGLQVEVVLFLFEESYLDETSTSRCYLLAVTGSEEPILGADPEENSFPVHRRLLQNVAWVSLDQMKEDGQVSRVLQAIAVP